MKIKKEKKKKDYKAIEADNELFEKFKKNFVKQTLRRASYRWPFKHMERQSQKIDYGMYKCVSCGSAFGPKELNSDHKNPIEDVKTGFTDWNNYIDRSFVKSNGFQTLCIPCHSAKSLVENEQRRANGQKEIRFKKKKK